LPEPNARSTGRRPAQRSKPPPGRRRLVDYPRAGRVGWRRWVPSWKLLAGLAGLGVASMFVAFAAAYAATPIPTAASLVKAETTIVYYADGKNEVGRFSVQDRRSVQLKEVPPQVRYAVLAAEDRTFYSNQGVSLRGTVRAAVNDVRGRSLQGGSTITQQYVKNYFDLRDRTIRRKAKEFFIALKINREKSKDEILQDYLNAIYFGRGAYGVQAASSAYFGTTVSKLNVSQAAFLAGIINGPELYDPNDGPASQARARQRWQYVIDGMVSEGWLSSEAAAQAAFPKVQARGKQVNALRNQNGYLMRMVSTEMEQRYRYTQRDIETGGLKIVTTFNKRMINDAVEAVNEALPRKRPKGLQVAVASIDPTTGAVRAIYGGSNYLVRNRNAATQDVAQAGSTFKPFALVAALEDGVGLKSRFDGSSPQQLTVTGENGDRVKVRNFGDEQFGMIDLIKATEHSVNTVYAQLNEKIGPDKTYDAAVRAGIPADSGMEKNALNVLGDAAPHPLDMANAYATFAAQGVYHRPYVVASITKLNGSGGNNLEVKPEGKRVFDADVMADATYAMQQVIRHGTGTYARNLDRPAAGKTGTSSDNKSAWFVGFTPQLTTAVAMYRIGSNGRPEQLVDILGRNEITGGSYPTEIWTRYMEAALDGQQELDFPEPAYVGEAINPAPVQTFTPAPVQTYTPPPVKLPTTPVVIPTPTPTATSTFTVPPPDSSPPKPPKPPQPNPPVNPP
jgi:membrane peptidoglycan carboxypeptidase